MSYNLQEKNCDLIIKADYILPIDKEMNIIEDGMVVVSGKDIIAVGESKKFRNRYKAKNEINVGNSVLMPGLINTHTHAAMAYFRGLADDRPLDQWLKNYIWPAEAKYVNSKFVEKSSELACLEMIKAGTTCFNDMYFFADITACVAKKSGLRACLGEGIIDFPTPSCKTPEQAIKKTRDLHKNYKDHELIRIFAVPHSIYTCSKDTLLKTKALSAECKMPMHIHISETKKEVDDCKKKRGQTPVKYLEEIGILGDNVIAAHSVWLDDNDLEIYAKRKAKVSHCPKSNMKLASGIARVPDMLDRKIIVGLGTDSAASNNTLDLFSEMRISALLHKVNKLDPTVINAREVIQMATINGAKTLGLENKIGSLKIGKRADMITINLDKPHLTPIYDVYSHLVYCAGQADVENVIIAGRIIMRDRKVITMDEERIIEDSKNFRE